MYMLCVSFTVEGGKKRTPGVGECVSNCRKIRNGDYQSCDGCDVYVTCSNGLITEDRPCAASLVWNDETRQCAGTSPTCDEGNFPEHFQYFTVLRTH